MNRSILAVTVMSLILGSKHSLAKPKPNGKRTPASVVEAKVKFEVEKGYEKFCGELFPTHEGVIVFSGTKVTLPTKNPIKGDWIEGRAEFNVKGTPRELADFMDFTGPVMGATFNPIDGKFTYWENFLNSGQATGKNLECKGRFSFSDPTDGIKAKVMADEGFHRGRGSRVNN